MAATLLVLVPAAEANVRGVTGAAIVPYASAAEVVEALASAAGPVVLWSDGVEAAERDAVARAIRAAGVSCIEVQAARWDGFSHSAISGACRGVIAGFGAAGVGAAVALLLEEGTSG